MWRGEQLVKGVHPRVTFETDIAGGAVDEVDVLEVGQLVELRSDARDAAAVGDEHSRAAVPEPVEDLVGLPPPVEPDQDGADVDCAPEGQAPLRVVRAEYGDPVTLTDVAAFTEQLADGVGLAEERSGRPTTVAVHEEGVCVTASLSERRDVAQRREPLLVDLHPVTEDVLLH